MIIADITRTMYREVIDKTLLGELFHPKNYQGEISARYSIAHARLSPGSASLPHTLLKSSEVYFILQGYGTMHVGDEQEEIKSGQLVYIPPGKIQHIENSGTQELVFLAIVDPMWSQSDEMLGEPDTRKEESDDPFLIEAIHEAERGLSEGGIPIGSVLVRDNVIIGRGHNRRVQNGNPMIHAEIDCLMNAGRIGTYKDCVLYSTLMPCYLCAGAVVQFGISEVVVGESRNFSGAGEFMESHGVRVMDRDDHRCIWMMTEFIRNNPDLWNEDIGE